MKRLIALALITLSIALLASCGQQGGEIDAPAAEIADEVSIAVSSHASWPYNADWMAWDFFEEGSGVKLNVTAIPDSDYTTKISLMMSATDTLPDIIHFSHKQQVDTYAPSGALLSLNDNMDKLPNFESFMEKLPETERDELLLQRTSGDGKMYSFPTYGTQTVQNLRSWIYRKDIFEKNNLAVPTTLDEMTDTARALKKLYPNSYPICLRSGQWQFAVLGPMWKNNFSAGLYYDFEAKSWRYGGTEPAMREIVEWLRLLQDEGLITPDFMTINTKSWEELMSTDRGFISLEYIVRLDFFNIPNREINPDYTWAVMAPPKANFAQLAKSNYDLTGYTICNTGKQAQINAAFKVIDWTYTDEATELLSWGKQGVTYNVVDGERKFIIDDGESPMTKYGIATPGTYQRLDPKSFEQSYSAEQGAQGEQVLAWLEDNVNPIYWFSLSDEDKAATTDLLTELDTYNAEMLAKFCTGILPMSEWDAYQAKLREIGTERLIEVYNAAYNKITAGK